MRKPRGSGKPLPLRTACRKAASQAAKRIAHTVLFFGAGKDPLNSFFAFGIQLLILGRVSGVVSQLLIIFPDMMQGGFYAAFGMGAKLLCDSLGTDLWIAAIL